MEHLRNTQLHERLHPALQLLGSLLHQHALPVLHTDGHDVAVVADVEEGIPRAFVHLAFQVRQHVVTVDMHLERLLAGLVALEQLLLDVGHARGGEEGRQPVLMGEDAV